MKKMIAVLLLVGASAAVFAGGAQETNEDGVVELEKGQAARASVLEDLEKIEVTGTIKFESPVAELEVGSQDYTLMIPGAREYMDYIQEGDRVTVTGYILDEETMPGPMGGKNGKSAGGMMHDLEVLEGNETLMVETVTIDGTTYELPWVENGFMAGEDRMGDGRRGNRQDGTDRDGNMQDGMQPRRFN